MINNNNNNNNNNNININNNNSNIIIIDMNINNIIIKIDFLLRGKYIRAFLLVFLLVLLYLHANYFVPFMISSSLHEIGLRTL